ncbi:hypothetical protein [Streptomyces sp. MBT65]|uniref:hypothetical protein n=1 Tax=Streptomyces sp. MBT65 TaxID=1488395 RepID=UPI00190DA7EB|nr:hypothetical protein [Streptomyces sp. MBT65]
MTETFAHAHAVAGIVVAELNADQLPFAVEIEEDFSSGHRVHLKVRATLARGLLAFASVFDVPVTRADTAFGVHFDAITRIEDVEVRASALVSPVQAADLEGQPAPLSEPLEAREVQPVPLGASVLAQVAAVVPVVPPLIELLGLQDVARCVRCGCTDERACEGGCYWVPNRQMVDFCSACATPAELQAMTYAAEISDGGE